jgi:phosphohistidine phosphatase
VIRRLVLLRHAKSSWDDPSLDDFDRPLAPRGAKAAPRMATYLKKKHLRPDLVLCSAALRTVQTWQLVSDVLGGEPEVKFLRGLYLGTPSRLLEAVRRAPDGAACVMLIGHNPGMEGLAVALAGPRSKEKALARLRSKFPTAALAEIEFETQTWAEIERGQGRLRRFVCPRDLKAD